MPPPPPYEASFRRFFIYMWRVHPSLTSPRSKRWHSRQSSGPIHSFNPRTNYWQNEGDYGWSGWQARGGRDWPPKPCEEAGPLGRRDLIMKVSEVGGTLDGFRPQSTGRKMDGTHRVGGWSFAFLVKRCPSSVKGALQLEAPPTFKVLIRLTGPHFGPSKGKQSKVDGSWLFAFSPLAPIVIGY